MTGPPLNQASVVGVVVPAAGLGVRLGIGAPKALRLLAGESMLLHAIRGLRACAEVGPIVVAAPAAELGAVRSMLAGHRVLVVTGGDQRADSVARALAALPPQVELVLVHDAARCLTPVVVIEQVIAALRGGCDAVVPVLPVHDTIKRVVGDRVVATVPRADLRAAQTPQGFRRAVLMRAYESDRADAAHTDDAGRAEAIGVEVVSVPGHEEAFKVTRPLDLLLAEAVLGAR